MRKIFFKINISKFILAFLLVSSAFAANTLSAHASTKSLMFKEDANLTKFTHKLIYKSLFSQEENPLNEDKDSKKGNNKAWGKINDLAEIVNTKEAENG